MGLRGEPLRASRSYLRRPVRDCRCTPAGGGWWSSTSRWPLQPARTGAGAPVTVANNGREAGKRLAAPDVRCCADGYPDAREGSAWRRRGRSARGEGVRRSDADHRHDRQRHEEAKNVRRCLDGGHGLCTSSKPIQARIASVIRVRWNRLAHRPSTRSEETPDALILDWEMALQRVGGSEDHAASTAGLAPEGVRQVERRGASRAITTVDAARLETGAQHAGGVRRTRIAAAPVVEMGTALAGTNGPR